MQLVGRACATCQKRIGSILEGKFCNACGKPFCYACQKKEASSAEQNKCPACGADASSPVATKYIRSKEEAKAAKPNPRDRIITVIFCLQFIALSFFAIGGIVLFFIPRTDENYGFALYLAGLFSAVGLFVEIVAYALYKRHSWARTAAITLLALSIPSIALPVAVIGLLILLNGRIWSAYVDGRTSSDAHD